MQEGNFFHDIQPKSSLKAYIPSGEISPEEVECIYQKIAK